MLSGHFVNDKIRSVAHGLDAFSQATQRKQPAVVERSVVFRQYNRQRWLDIPMLERIVEENQVDFRVLYQ